MTKNSITKGQSTGMYKAFIRCVKSIQHLKADRHIPDNWFTTVNVIVEPLIIADTKDEVKRILVDLHPQFFQNGKVYERETKDQAQFFYAVIFPLYEWEKNQIAEGEWTGCSCGQVHENKYVSRPTINEKVFGRDKLFCTSEDNNCMMEYKVGNWGTTREIVDDATYNGNVVYIYKCTEKSTGKCYIGKTRNAPFFRWWNHLTQSGSRFGCHLRQSKLSEWTFEVLEELPHSVEGRGAELVESKYIILFDSINNGFNQVISNKDAYASN